MIDCFDVRIRSPMIRAATLIVVAVLLLVLLINQYWLGMYQRVLVTAISPAVLLLAAVALFLTRHQKSQHWITLPALLALVIPQLILLPDGWRQSLDALLMIPFLAYLVLGRRLAHRFNLVMALVLLLQTMIVLPPLTALRYLLIFLLVSLSVAFLAQMIHQKHIVMRSLALRDSASGAFNSRQFAAVLRREVARSERARRPMSLIGMSLEEFGQLLHLHGEMVVAQFLPDLVNAVRDEVRAGDEVFRIRDELFLLMLPDCPEDGAIVLMERIKRQFEQRQWPALADVALAVATVTRTPNETAAEVERRLMKRLAKQRRASLQAAAFANG
jgi:diguanylate cyclase